MLVDNCTDQTRINNIKKLPSILARPISGMGHGDASKIHANVREEGKRVHWNSNHGP